MRILFMRHGERSRQGTDDPLTPLGREMATAAGAWLRSEGLLPTAAVTTGTIRTRTTAQLACAAAGVAPPTRARSGLPVEAKGWANLLMELGVLAPDDRDLVLLVGHDKTQKMFEGKVFLPSDMAAVPSHNRAGIYLVEQDDKGAWKVTRKYDGTPTAPSND
jgi:phosphohistidine phosphatase SixA